MRDEPLVLLAPDEPAPYRVFSGRATCPFVLTGDHAGRRVPRALGTLGLAEHDLERHIAWDIGIAGLSEKLAARLGAFLILQTYSRLVIDCNRPLDSATSIAVESEHTSIPGNRGISAEEVRARIHDIFEPYHGRIRAELERRQSAGEPTVLVTMHSFTPRFKGVDRHWQCGVLYNRDARLAKRLFELLSAEGLTVGDNEPYRVTDQSDYAIPVYGERAGNVHVELEVRQDLITTDEGQERWAELLSRLLPRAAEPLLTKL